MTRHNAVMFGKAKTYKRAAANWYVEEAWTVDAILIAENPIGALHDPACGGFQIPRRAKALGYGHHVTGSDIVKRHRRARVADFLDPSHRDRLPKHIDTIITNPPYGRDENGGLELAFIKRGLELATMKVIVLVRLAFLETPSRALFFEQSGLSRIYINSSRVSMPPGDLLAQGKVKQAGGKTPSCWLVWDKQLSGPVPSTYFLRRP